MCPHLASGVTGYPKASRTPGKTLNQEVSWRAISPRATASDCARSLRERSPGRAHLEPSAKPPRLPTWKLRARQALAPALRTPRLRRHPPGAPGVPGQPRGRTLRAASHSPEPAGPRSRGAGGEKCSSPAPRDYPAQRRLLSAPLRGPRDLDLWSQR